MRVLTYTHVLIAFTFVLHAYICIYIHTHIRTLMHARQILTAYIHGAVSGHFLLDQLSIWTLSSGPTHYLDTLFWDGQPHCTSVCMSVCMIICVLECIRACGSFWCVYLCMHACLHVHTYTYSLVPKPQSYSICMYARERIMFITHLKPLQPKTAITDDLHIRQAIVYVCMYVCMYVRAEMNADAVRHQ